jgi:hypothetical protein
MAKCVRLLAQIRPNEVPNSKVHRKAARRGMRAYHTRWPRHNKRRGELAKLRKGKSGAFRLSSCDDETC